jgi:hypothetical protein
MHLYLFILYFNLCRYYDRRFYAKVVIISTIFLFDIKNGFGEMFIKNIPRDSLDTRILRELEAMWNHGNKLPAQFLFMKTILHEIRKIDFTRYGLNNDTFLLHRIKNY